MATTTQEYHGKVADEFKRLRDNFHEHAEKGNVDKTIREHVKSDLDKLVTDNEKRSR
jgi:hypothetical protein